MGTYVKVFSLKIVSRKTDFDQIYSITTWSKLLSLPLMSDITMVHKMKGVHENNIDTTIEK